PVAIEEVDEVLGRDVAGGAGREGAAAESADGGVEEPHARLERRVGVGEARVARVVQVDAGWADAFDEAAHLTRRRDADRVGEDDLVGVLRQARRSEEHTSELQSPYDLVCRLLLEKKKK